MPSKRTKTFQSFSSEETKRFGEGFAKKLANGKWQMANGRKNAMVFALTGELGAGKTTFAQGFLRGLGIKRRATSPTFIIFRRFNTPRSNVKGQMSNVRSVYHVDAYRLKKTMNLAPLELDKIFREPRNIILIEWAENIKKILPKNTIWLRFKHGKKENERRIK